MATEALVQRLAAHAMLGGVPREELEWLAAHGTLRVLAPGEILSPKGVPVEQMSIILSGHVAMMVDRGAGPRKTREWRGGEVIGRVALLAHRQPAGRRRGAGPRRRRCWSRATCLPAMARACHEVTAALVHGMVDRARDFTSKTCTTTR